MVVSAIAVDSRRIIAGCILIDHLTIMLLRSSERNLGFTQHSTTTSPRLWQNRVLPISDLQLS
jgi:hypothetical protein